MENLEEQLNEQDAVIRNYLLDRVDEKTARKMDEKLFLDPDFYDCVLLVEQEIIEDLVAGRLNDEDRIRAAQIYDLLINREKREFESALYKVAEEANRKGFTQAANLAITEPNKEKSFKWLDWRYLIPAFGLLVVISLAVWYASPDKRGVLEKELTRLNQKDAGQVSGVNLQNVTLESDAVRSAVSASTMPKVRISETDEVIGFRLGLIATSQELFEVTFIDEQGNEMFSVSALTSQSDANGKYVFVKVPSRFFKPGDFQINLQGRAGDGTLSKAGNFTFRVNRS